MAMNALAFDTHKAVKMIHQAGAEEAVAEAVVATIGSAISEQVATKADVGLLRTDVAKDMALLRTDVELLRTDVALLHRDVEQLRKEVAKDMEVLRADVAKDMEALEQRLLVRLGALMVVGLGVLATLMKLL